jgi:hypothetical protein
VALGVDLLKEDQLSELLLEGHQLSPKPTECRGLSQPLLRQRVEST